MRAKSDLATLAVAGGLPIRRGGWPKWPRYTKNTLAALHSVLESGRWAISGPFSGTPSVERAFASRFAEFCGVSYCVPTDHGSSALLVALEALDVGAGDEVIVPAMTWVATATAVTNVNAIPVIVDVDAHSLCIDPKCVEDAITDKTRAIIPVHLYNGMADMDQLLSISDKYNIPIIEDSSHVHGTRWGDRSAGALGAVGTFSMQQSKVLTSGEGGAVVTDDPRLARRMEQLRADSRIYTDKKVNIYDMDLVTCGEVQGTNYCLSEFQAALLLDQLARLEEQNRLRESNAVYLDVLLSEIDGLYPLGCHSQVTRRTYYCYVVRRDREVFANRSVSALCCALSAELNIPFSATYEPLARVRLYRPESKRRNHLSESHLARLHDSKVECPVADQAHMECICFPHSVLLGSRKDMQHIALAFAKIQRLARKVPEVE